MYLHYLLYRDSEEVCSNQEMEIAITIQITKDIVPGYNDDEPYTDEDPYMDDPNQDDGFDFFDWASWYLIDENDHVVFNSTADYLPLFVSFEFQDTIFVDLCLPRNLEYKFVYQNPNSIGENPVALIEVVKDGNRVARVEGNIGDFYEADIPAGGGSGGNSGGSRKPPNRKFQCCLDGYQCTFRSDFS